MAIKYLWPIIFLAGCVSTPPEPIIIKEPIEVLVPVSQPLVIPQELLTFQSEKLPVFINSNDTQAVIGLSEEGILDLRILIRDLVTQNNAWRAWAIEQGK